MVNKSMCFFTQKTAYETRISDWSSDVCSSDLVADLRCARAQVIAAVADALQVAVADDAGIGRPAPMAWRVGDQRRSGGGDRPWGAARRRWRLGSCFGCPNRADRTSTRLNSSH